MARSFLLLEDDYDVDWEVDQDERTCVSHPHRAPLRGGCAQRRAGQLPARPQACLSPVGPAALSANGARSRRSQLLVGPERGAETCGDGPRVTLDQ
jgi:hypothetical protein